LNEDHILMYSYLAVDIPRYPAEESCGKTWHSVRGYPVLLSTFTTLMKIYSAGDVKQIDMFMFF